MPMDTVNAAYRKVLEIAPDRSESRIQLIQNLWEKKDYDEVIRLSNAAHDYNPEEMVFYYFGGMAHYMKHEEDATLEEFRRGVGQINSKSSPDLVSDLYMIMGDILHGKNRQAEAFAASIPVCIGNPTMFQDSTIMLTTSVRRARTCRRQS